MIRDMVKQSILYARREKSVPDFETTEGEMMRFLGILLLSGYHVLPEESHYWSNQPDLGVRIVSEAMTSKRFKEVKRFLHLADNANLQLGNKVAKVTPLYNSLNTNLTIFGVFQKELSVDESMVPYYGKFGIKMFIKGKPIRFGYKLWCICGKDGFPYHMDIYCGKDNQDTTGDPLGTRVVNNMLAAITEHTDVKQHVLYFDNFFTSYALMASLSDKGIRAIGTLRENRMAGAKEKLMSVAEVKKQPRGFFDYASTGTVHIVRWHDNSVVNVASNFATHQPVQQTTRRVKGASNVTVTQPFLIKKYNEAMDGVDLLDHLLASYRPSIQGKNGGGLSSLIPSTSQLSQHGVCIVQ